MALAETGMTMLDARAVKAVMREKKLTRSDLARISESDGEGKTTRQTIGNWLAKIFRGDPLEDTRAQRLAELLGVGLSEIELREGEK